ncbi:MAG TPA: hypothetical protein PLT92_14935 [Ignavibacteriaceae bacterium]|jgi:hypothetical protein|nr:hypothetical protein [Ignavibacteriaceae bacterium]HPO57148.1 hypothetical protein [Ignavibacteriaceae bacterium]
MNVNIWTNVIAGGILLLSVVYLLLRFPSVDYFQLILALFLSVSNYITGKERKDNDVF